MEYPINDAALDLIIRYEGCKLRAYPDPGTSGPPWAIGYGHTGPEVHEGLEWSQAEADTALRDDLERVAQGVDYLLEDNPVSGNQFGAMVSLTYDIGLGAFAASSVLRFHNEGMTRAAAASFALWNKAAGHVVKGLVERRLAEAELYLEPTALI